MRSEMERGTSASLDARKDLLVKYFKALTVMASRFPINPDSENLSIPFTWFDAFSQSKKVRWLWAEKVTVRLDWYVQSN